jgi:TnpA family transposase
MSTCSYVGVDQLTNGPESEHRGRAFALDAVRRAQNAIAVNEFGIHLSFPFSSAKRASLEDVFRSANSSTSIVASWLTATAMQLAAISPI